MNCIFKEGHLRGLGTIAPQLQSLPQSVGVKDSKVASPPTGEGGGTRNTKQLPHCFVVEVLPASSRPQASEKRVSRKK